jgi:Mrp family chromosome partitioning ATPase
VDPAQFAPMLARLPLLLDEAVARADRVVVDAAPVGAASETLQIAAMCDQVVLAVRPRHTDRHRLVAAADLLSRARAPVVGVVATQSSVESGGYGYGYGYGYSDGETTTAGEALAMSATPAQSRGL